MTFFIVAIVLLILIIVAYSKRHDEDTPASDSGAKQQEDATVSTPVIESPTVQAADNAAPVVTPIQQTSAPSKGASNVRQVLSELKELYDAGIITEDEYSRKKEQVLNSMNQ